MHDPTVPAARVPSLIQLAAEAAYAESDGLDLTGIPEELRGRVVAWTYASENYQYLINEYHEWETGVRSLIAQMQTLDQSNPDLNGVMNVILDLMESGSKLFEELTGAYGWSVEQGGELAAALEDGYGSTSRTVERLMAYLSHTLDRITATV